MFSPFFKVWREENGSEEQIGFDKLSEEDKQDKNLLSHTPHPRNLQKMFKQIMKKRET